MYNIVFDTETSRQNIFNDSNPIICMMIHDFNAHVLETFIFYKTLNDTVKEYINDATESYHIIEMPKMTKNTFAEEAFRQIMQYMTTFEATSTEMFEPVFISGSFFSTDAIVSAMNEVFRKNAKLLEAKDRIFSIFTMINLGVMSIEHCHNIITQGFNTIKPEDFELGLLGQTYLKTLVTIPGRK